MSNSIEFEAIFALRRLVATEAKGGLSSTTEELLDRGLGYPALLALAKKHDDAHEISAETLETTGDEENSSSNWGPVLPAQRRIWSICSDEGGSAAYMLARAFFLKGRLDNEALAKAVGRVARRHESLRAVFRIREGELIQEIVATNSMELLLVDLAQSSNPYELAVQLAEQRASTAPDLSVGPLAGATLYLLGGNQFMFLVWAHHIVCDGTSWKILLAEIEDCYRNPERFEKEPAVDFLISYAAFAKLIAAEASRAAAPYWDHRIASRDLTLDLARDFPLAARNSFRGSVERFEFSPEEAFALKRVSMATKTTPFLALLAIIKMILARYTERSCICTLVPIVGRDWLYLEDKVGFFAEALLSISDVDRGSTFTELVSALTRDFARDYKHRRISLDDVLARSVAANAIPAGGNFEVMVSMLEGQQMMQLGDLHGRPIALARRNAKMDLSFEFHHSENSLALEIEYRTALFAPDRIRRLCDHFRQLLRQLSLDPNVRIKDGRMIPENEMREIARASFGDRVPWQPEDDFVALFTRAVAKDPRAIAIWWQEESITYFELDRRSDVVAAALVQRGIQPGHLVGVCMTRDPHLIVTLVGIVKSGAAYVPIDPRYPEDRIDYIVRDSRVSLIVTTSRDRSVIHGEVNVLEFESLVASSTTALLPVNAGSNSPMFIIYTSGSTGNPKGIVISRRNVAGLISWAKYYYDIDELRNVLAATSICFDMSVFEVFVPLALGHSFSLVSDALALIDPAPTLRPSLIDTVPSAIREVMLAGRLPSSVRTINLGGELLSQHTVDDIKTRYPTVRIVDLYGPSEDTVFSTCGERTAGGEQSIGRPLANKQVWIVDPELQVVPFGQPGELLIGGTGVADGYLHREQLTEERFIVAALPNGSCDRVYRTGDYGRFLPSGNIEFLGRRDNQHKIRGYRIELGEIEAAFRSAAGVRDVAVVVDKTVPERPDMIAFVVLQEFQESTLAPIKKHVLQRLPPFMVPTTLMELAELPQTPSGKVDRRLLLAAYRQSKPGSPTQASDRRFESVVCQVLGLNCTPGDLALTALGGNSLSAVRISHEFQRRTGTRVPFIEILTAPALMTLAAKYNAAAASGAEQWARIDREREDSFPVLSQQRAIWMNNQFNPESTAFHMCGGFRIIGQLNVELLVRALLNALDRHEAFRIGFTFTNGSVRQVLLPKSKSGIEHYDLRFELNVTASSRHLIQEFAGRKFDLRQGPLWRFAIIRLGEAEWNLWCNIHHIVCDGWSIQLLAEEISKQYAVNSRPENSQMLDRDFLDYACAIANDTEGQKCTDEFWRQRLRGSFHSSIFGGFTGTAPKDTPAHIETILLETERAITLKHYAKQHGITLLSLTTALVHSFLHFHLGVPQIIGGCIFSNRESATFHRRVGLFMVTLPFVSESPKTEEFKAYALSIQQAIMKATEYPRLALPEVLSQLASEGVGVSRQVFEVLVSQHEAWAALKLEGLDVTPLSAPRQTAKVPLAVKLIDAGDSEVSFLIEGSPAVFTALELTQLAEKLADFVRTIIQGGFVFGVVARRFDAGFNADTTRTL